MIQFTWPEEPEKKYLVREIGDPYPRNSHIISTPAREIKLVQMKFMVYSTYEYGP